MKTTRILAALLLGCSLAAAQVQAPESGAGTIKTQIKNLDNDSFEVRTKAMDALRAAGEAARADLEAARKSESLEVRTRAETLLKDLDSKKAQAPVQKRAVKPLVPDDEKKPADKKPGETGAAQPPRFEDFKDPNAYMQAMQKWMQDWMNRQIGGEPRGWNIMRGPDEKDWNEFTIETPGGQLVTSGATSISVTHKDGETVTWKTGEDGVTLTVRHPDEKGEPVTESWSSKTEEDFKKEHADLWDKYHEKDGATRAYTLRSGGRPMILRPGKQVPAPIIPEEPVEIGESDGPRLGIIPSTVPPVLDKQLKLNGDGVVIDSVSEGSLAERLGIKAFDVLVRLDGQPVRSRADVVNLMQKKDAPATATVKVIREGAPLELSAPREKAK